MGYGQSRFDFYTDADIRKMAENYHGNGIPLDMIYLDIDYMHNYKGLYRQYPGIPQSDPADHRSA